ncbi:hypothetical protein [Bacillus ndiopicus]|uniref:hypothetical protein n=1 Tax=Bacillus ndiopicus TaxID=1347368 RepID=UPI0005AAD499|nr:hypothetical protein [Bacillus ndiopicus]
MKKYLLIFSILTALLLAACNAESQSEEPSPETDSNDVTVENPSDQEETDKDGAIEEKEKEEDEEVDTENITSEESPSSQVHSITYKSNNQEMKGSTINTKSPQQDYHMDLMEGFTITAEEPGRDVVMADADPDVSMRIEAFPKSEAVFDELLTNTNDTVSAIAPEDGYNEYDLSSIQLNEQITNMHTFYVEFEGETVLTLLYELPEKFIRLTIFDNEADLKDALIQMGLTIE